MLLPWLQIMIARDGWRWACLVVGSSPRCCCSRSICCASGRSRHRPSPRRRRGAVPVARRGATSRRSRGRRSPGRCRARYAPRRSVDRARLLRDPLRVVRRAGPPDQVSHVIGVSPIEASWAVGIVSLAGVPGQMVFGHASDRIGRESTWAIGCFGFVSAMRRCSRCRPGTTPVLLPPWSSRRAFAGHSSTHGARADRCRRSTRGRTSARSSAP